MGESWRQVGAPVGAQLAQEVLTELSPVQSSTRTPALPDWHCQPLPRPCRKAWNTAWANSDKYCLGQGKHGVLMNPNPKDKDTRW